MRQPEVSQLLKLPAFEISRGDDALIKNNTIMAYIKHR
jgi:hypothetical protein